VNSFFLTDIDDGTYNWNVMCSDGFTESSAASNRVFTIDAPNNPILEFIGPKSVNENRTLEFVVRASDEEDSESDLRFSAAGLPLGASFVDNLDGTAIE